jgi:hypothetical protein
MGWENKVDLALALGMMDNLLRIQRTSRQYSMNIKHTTRLGDWFPVIREIYSPL